MFAEVIIDIKNKQVNRSFDYHIPSFMEGVLFPGQRVLVPFGRLKRNGYVIAIKEESEVAQTKDILDLVDVKPVLNEEAISMAKYIAEEDFTFYATALEAMVPLALRMKYQKIVRWKTDSLDERIIDRFKRKKEILLSSIPKDLEPIIYDEVRKGNLEFDTKLKRNREEKTRTYVHFMDKEGIPSSKKGRDMLAYLEEVGEDLELSLLMEDSGYSKSVFETLERDGFISIYQREIEPEEDIQQYEDKIVELSLLQRHVYEQLHLGENKTYLLHGVTGSGKTELYMRWIQDAINQGKTALMLVPEISLTPQITALFYARFKESIAVLHSRLTIAQKYEAWRRIVSGDVKIVVGARSAIFAPLKNIGIILIDECHEASYKQSNNPKYSAIDLARIRSRRYDCPMVLGSATPNVEDYYFATNGEYELLSLPDRANGKKLPLALVVDMREELKSGNRTPISGVLKKKIVDCYKRHEQSILFLNRRGYSTFVQCRSCGEAVKCPHCDVSLTYHGYTNTLKCHYCGYSQMNVTKCNSCGSDKIRFVGSGTEKVVDEVKKILPEATILRMDMDTTEKMEDYERCYHDFKEHKADIMVGTQMVTKGLDFENVTLVGVLNADLALHYPTFDANQVAFNLIEQVSGRAGRAEKDGEVVIQTYDPSHYVITCASHHDYEQFYATEIQRRSIAQMPPFSSIVEVEIRGKDMKIVKKEANLIAESFRKASQKSVVLGPSEAYIFKKKDLYYYQIQLQIEEDALLEQLRYIYPMYQDNKDVSISITRK